MTYKRYSSILWHNRWIHTSTIEINSIEYIHTYICHTHQQKILLTINGVSFLRWMCQIYAVPAVFLYFLAFFYDNIFKQNKIMQISEWYVYKLLVT